MMALLISLEEKEEISASGHEIPSTSGCWPERRDREEKRERERERERER
jgi:hypothetical protein